MEIVGCELNIILTNKPDTGALWSPAGTVWAVTALFCPPAAVQEVGSPEAEDTESRRSCAASQQSTSKLKLPVNEQNILSRCRGSVNANLNLWKEIQLYTPKYK